MAWSTRQLADLAGTTVKTVRHYHDVGLLPEPERAVNGYKQYGVHHLVRLLRVKRLADLGVPLAQIAQMDDSGPPTQALRELDAELATTVERLQKVRSELSLILHENAPVDAPEGFAGVTAELGAADRALVLVYSRIFGSEEMAGLQELLRDFRPNAVDAEFENLSADASEEVRVDLAARLAPQLRELTAGRPWLSADAVAARPETLQRTISDAILDLYNPAQVDVVRRVGILLQARDPGSSGR